MANYIKIKAADVNVANQLSDVLIGHVDSVYQGLVNGDGSADKFTVTGKGKEWANQFISAVTANPGGIMSIVQNDSGVKITDIVIA